MRSAIFESHSHTKKMITVASDPYVLLCEPEKETYSANSPELTSHSPIAIAAPGVIPGRPLCLTLGHAQ